MESICEMEKEIFQLIQASLFEDKPVEMDNWREVFQEMKQQTIAALPGEWLIKHPVDGAQEWSKFCLQQKSRWVQLMYGQAKLLELLHEKDIPCVILKGASAACAYPYPNLRTMGDVDFLVKRADYEKTAFILEENGYRLTHDKNPMMHHYTYAKDGVSFELHKRLNIVNDSNEKLLALFENGIDHRGIRRIDDFSFPVLPDALNGLVLMFHINQHLREGLGLRQIIDWMMFMNRLPSKDWENEMLPLLKEYGMEKLAITVTAMCQEYLGLKQIVRDTENYPYRELMEYIMDMGNFGRKNGVKGKISRFIYATPDIGRFFRKLQKGGLANWKAARKYRILRPFAWVYQSFRILSILIRSRLTAKDYRKQRNEARREERLMEMLGLGLEKMI